MALTKSLINQAKDIYCREKDRYIKLARLVSEICQKQVIQENVIRAATQWRAKDPKRFEDKLMKWLDDSSKAVRLDGINSLDDVFKEAGGDLAGVRITTYVETDRNSVVEAIQALFTGPGGQVLVDKKDDTAFQRGSLYRATHCQVIIRDEELSGNNDNLKGLSCEIQVCSLLAHVWNEIEHDLGYKPLAGELSSLEKDLLRVLGKETEAGDLVITNLLEAKEKRLNEKGGIFIDEYDFVAKMRASFPSATRLGTNAAQLYQDLMGLNINTLDLVRSEVIKDDTPETAGRLVEQLSEYLRTRDGDKIRLDSQSSDLLLMLLLKNRLTPTTRKDVTPLNRKPGGLMEQSNASLQRGDQG
jgi:ppGpp synthetase/RelA/SpoT-type nucleotidyltranferase